MKKGSQKHVVRAYLPSAAQFKAAGQDRREFWRQHKGFLEDLVQDALDGAVASMLTTPTKILKDK